MVNGRNNLSVKCQIAEQMTLSEALDAAARLGFALCTWAEFDYEGFAYRAGYDGQDYVARQFVNGEWIRIPRDHGRWGL